MYFDIPVLHAVTGFIPQRKLFLWNEILENEDQPVKVVSVPTHVDSPKAPQIPLNKSKTKVVQKATLPFLLAEVCQEPPQLRMKALQARPAGYMQAKATIATVQTPPAEEEEEDSDLGDSYDEDDEDEQEEEEEEKDEEEESKEEEEEKAAEDEVELVEGGFWSLWDDEKFYTQRPADFQVYYSPDEFITTLHDTTKLVKVTLPPPMEPPASEDEPKTVGVGFWYQGILGSVTPKMDITLVSPWLKQAPPADL